MLLVSLTECNRYVDNDCSSLQTTRDNLRTSENHCANYRVGVGLLGMKWMPKPDLNISISDQYCANYRVAVDPLVGQGWELKATYPVLAVFIILQRRRCWSFSVGWVWV
jgi:hypothetical protein